METTQTNTKWTPDKIRGALVSILGRDWRPQLAEKAKKSGPWVSRHVSGTLKTMAGKELIADAINRPVAELWPDSEAA